MVGRPGLVILPGLHNFIFPHLLVSGIAQSSSSLFFNRRDRMPGDMRMGKIYTYPAGRWRKHKRQYYVNLLNFPKRAARPDPPEASLDGGTYPS
jgi:hypothetical protein